MTTALISALSKVAPDVLTGLIEHLEQSERELAGTEMHRATMRELTECVAALRAIRQMATSTPES